MGGVTRVTVAAERVVVGAGEITVSVGGRDVAEGAAVDTGDGATVGFDAVS